jgi:glucose-1-phosphate adenylyltransferase
LEKTALGIILAGGRGTRMEVLCRTRPKPVLPFAGSYRVIDFALSNCIHSGIKDIVALADYQRVEMTQYLRNWFAANDRKTSLSVLHPRTGSYSGTADAVFQNLDSINRRDADEVVILAGDHIYTMDYRRMLSFHRETGADATVAVARVPFEQAHRFGSVVTGPDQRVVEFAEKSSSPKSDLVSMGIYIFNKESLADYLSQDAADPDSRHDFGYSILPGILRTGKLYAFQFDGYWRDIGTVESYYESHMDILKEKPRLTNNSTWPILGERHTPSRPVTYEANHVVNSVVSHGCVIEGYVENSVLSPGVRVEKFAVVKNSILMSNTRIGYHSIVDECILDERVKVGEFCYVGFGPNQASEDRKITILGAEVTVPDHTAIGSRCIVSPRTGPDSFRSRAIPSGTIIPAPA